MTLRLVTEQEPRFRRVTIRQFADFDRRHLRVRTYGTHRLIVGPTRGDGPLVVQAVLHPVAEPESCQVCNRARLGWRF